MALLAGQRLVYRIAMRASTSRRRRQSAATLLESGAVGEAAIGPHYRGRARHAPSHDAEALEGPKCRRVPQLIRANSSRNLRRRD
jgi:hypothetical protein